MEMEGLANFHQTLRFFLDQRGTSSLHLNKPTWINDGLNEVEVDFLCALVLFWILRNLSPSKIQNGYFFLKQTNECQVKTIAKPNQASTTTASTCRLIQMQGWCSSLDWSYNTDTTQCTP